MKKVTRTMRVVEVTYPDKSVKHFTGMSARQIQSMLGEEVKAESKDLKFECTEDDFLSVAHVAVPKKSESTEH